jgi:hypothetical protein
MTDLAIITPSRGRPDRFAELVLAVGKTCRSVVEIWLGLDDDDPSDYAPAVEVAQDYGIMIHGVRGVRRSLTDWTNELARRALAGRRGIDRPSFLASLGDDHRPRTAAWDEILINAIEHRMTGPGFAYGNDLFQGSKMPTAWVASATAVEALGWMMLPRCAHMYVDTAIYDLGTMADRLWYEPGVIIEHVHPMAGKIAWDTSYRESNTGERYAADQQAFQAWRGSGAFEQDTRTLTALQY